ncbi:hypothetical protein [Pelagibius marinus]|uniref:hypothetical protein n=1 Tax=Pelagibius marinus TaxID=2762760 RepID=UPI001872A7F3|nr:hypothetical protein [Pelagibius marinus]
MRLFLMLSGAAVSVGALLFWIYLQAMAKAWHTSNAKQSMKWLNKEALRIFWVPFAAGAAIIFIGWSLP